MGCDFFITGCHKWLFGPRGTGIIYGNDFAWSNVRPTIPSFIDSRAWDAWQNDRSLLKTTAPLMSPGGFKSFEHLWALPEAFTFHTQIGKRAVADRTHELATILKNGLLELPQLEVITPSDRALSSGIVCFDVKGHGPWETAEYLRRQGIVASVSPYASRHVRLATCIYNFPEEIEVLLRLLRNM